MELCCGLITGSPGKIHEVPPTFPGRALFRLRPKVQIKRRGNASGGRRVYVFMRQTQICTDRKLGGWRSVPTTNCTLLRQRDARLHLQKAAAPHGERNFYFIGLRNTQNTTESVSSKQESSAVSCRSSASDGQTEYVRARRQMKPSLFRTISSHPSVSHTRACTAADLSFEMMFFFPSSPGFKSYFQTH